MRFSFFSLFFLPPFRATHPQLTNRVPLSVTFLSGSNTFVHRRLHPHGHPAAPRGHLRACPRAPEVILCLSETAGSEVEMDLGVPDSSTVSHTRSHPLNPPGGRKRGGEGEKEGHWWGAATEEEGGHG